MRDVQARRSSGEGLDLMSTFAELANQPIPPVDPKDLRAVWEFTREAPATSSFSVNLVAQVCNPGVNVFAVFMRRAVLELAVRKGLPDSHLDPTAFDVAATFPIPAFDQFDSDDFLRQIENARS